MLFKPRRIPVTLLTGFLGAGKTTVLNHLLRAARSERIAVIVNEFGEIGLDHDLIETSSETLVLMESGCLCCSIRGDLADTLDDLRRDREQGDIHFDRVVIETTGIADPGPIQHTLLVEPAIAESYALDGVVTVADAANGSSTFDRHFEAVAQIAVADRLLVAKADLVTAARLTAFEARLRAINPTAPILRADRGRVAPDALFGLDIAHGEGGAAAAARWGVMALDAGAAGGASSAGRDGAVDALTAMLQRQRHEPRVMSATAVIETPIEPLVFDLWLETILTLCGPELLRFKAIIHIAGEEAPLALHAVQHVLHPPVALPRWPSDDRRSRFVLIGKNIPRRLLDESIAFLRNPPELAASDPFSEPEDASRGATAPAPA